MGEGVYVEVLSEAIRQTDAIGCPVSHRAKKLDEELVAAVGRNGGPNRGSDDV